MASKVRRKRPRGGASVPCPSCGRPTSVLDTRWKSSAAAVTRLRRCPSCGAEFQTRERVVAVRAATVRRTRA